MAPSDDELIRLVQQHDPEAFELFFGRYEEAIRRHLARMLRDDHAANDLLQEVFMRVWTHADQWEGRGPVKGWLFRIATNYAVSYLRSPRNRREHSLQATTTGVEQMPTASALIESPLAGPEMLTLFAERHASLRLLIGRLPLDKQVVFRMVYEEEMDTRDVAATLGIAEGTVKSRLHYARKWLAQAWKTTQREHEEGL